jgi:hypothetical protein
MNLDGRGIPGVSVVTREFADAVEVQAKALGFEPAVVYVAHPIQNRTADELKALADEAIAPVLKLLTSRH